MPGIFQRSLRFHRNPRTAPSEARIEKQSKIPTLTGHPSVLILTLWNLGNRYASDCSFPQGQLAGLQELSTSSPGGSRYLRGVHWPHTRPTGCLTCGRCIWPSGLQRRFSVPSFLPPSSPHTNAGTNLSATGESGRCSAVTRKWLTSQAERTEVASRLGPRAADSKLIISQPEGRSDGQRPASGPRLPFHLACTPGSRPRAFSHPAEPQWEDSSPFLRMVVDIDMDTDPAGRQPTLLPGLRHRPGAGKAGSCSQPGSSTSTRTGSFVKEKKQSPEGEVLWSRASFKSQVLFPMEGSLENC